MTEITIVLPIPPRELSQNSSRQGSWRKRAKKAKGYRTDSYMITRDTMLEGVYKWKRASAQAVFYWPTNRRRDYRNAEAMLKAAYDGMVDAGLIVDDRSDVLTHQPTAFRVDKDRPRVEITVRRSDKGS
jgi:Holliday junction resolvase RusA-like endonuclease